MSSMIEAESTLTDRYQTTVPETVRRALQLGKRDKIRYTIRGDGEVVLTRVATDAEEDPVLANFLTFLAADMAEHPEGLQALSADLPARVQALLGDVALEDWDEALPDEEV